MAYGTLFIVIDIGATVDDLLPVKTASAEVPRHVWILIALQAADRSCLSPVQLQKSLFVLGERRSEALSGPFYDFRPYHYGPFDADIYRDSDNLAAHGLIEIHRVRNASVRVYSLSADGREAAARVTTLIPATAVRYLSEVVLWAQSLTFDELVRAIYDAYPAMRANSIFRDTEPQR